MNILVLTITPLLLFTNDYGTHNHAITDVTLFETMNVFDVMPCCMPLEETICFLRLAMSGKLTLFMSLGITYICNSYKKPLFQTLLPTLMSFIFILNFISRIQQLLISTKIVQFFYNLKIKKFIVPYGNTTNIIG